MTQQPHPTSFLDLFGQPTWARRIEETVNKLGAQMATISEALADWTGYAGGLKDALAAAQTALKDAQDTIAQLRDTDAAEDAEQVAQLQAQIAGQIEDALTAVRNPPPPPEESTGDTPPSDDAPEVNPLGG